MRQQTYERLEGLYQRYYGYITTPKLLEEGFSNRQITGLQQDGYLEKIVNGYFWLARSGLQKPADYKAIEVCMVNPEAVIAKDSSCFYRGLIGIEPPKLSVCTRRDDRHRMDFPFAIVRHYLSESNFMDGVEKVETKFGNYQVYDVERSVYDCIRFKDSIDEDIFELVIERYQKDCQDSDRAKRLLAYAKEMKFARQAEKYLDDFPKGS